MKKTICFLIAAVFALSFLTSCGFFKPKGAKTETAGESTSADTSVGTESATDTEKMEETREGNTEPVSAELRVEEAYHITEPVPNYQGAGSDTRDYSVPKVTPGSAGADAFNEDIDRKCREWIDKLNEPENNNWTATVTYTFEINGGTVAIDLQLTCFPTVPTDHIISVYQLFYYDSASDRRIYDWREYLSVLGYQSDRMENAVKRTERYIDFITPNGVTSVSNPVITGMIIGKNNSEVLVNCDYEGLTSGNRDFVFQYSTSELLELYNTDDSSELNGWKDDYIDFINREIVDFPNNHSYKLIDINGDSVPELFVDMADYATGGRLVTFFDGKVDFIRIDSLQYIEGRNLLTTSGGHMGYYFNDVYSIVNGDFVRLASGRFESVSQVPPFTYYWNDSEVSEEEYNSLLNALFDSEQAISPFDGAEYSSEQGCYVGNGLCDRDEIIEAINNY